ncbi:CvpA family protein [candidate division KSB1 bacterium]|nr:CvpA family protein [candidate division KSB1 bacterium]
MNTVDIVILVFLTVFVYLGARRGLIDEILGLTGWIIAVVCAIKFGGSLAAIISEKAPNLQMISSVLAALIILFGIRFAFLFFIKILKSSAPQITENNTNKVAGAFLGFLQGVFIVGILVLIFLLIPFGRNIKDSPKNSVLFPHMKKVSVFMVNTVANFIPQAQKPLSGLLEKIDEDMDEKNGVDPDDLKKVREKIDKGMDEAGDKLPMEVPKKEDVRKMEKKVKELNEELRR